MTKVYHVNYLDKSYSEGRVECVKKFKTEDEAKKYIEKEHEIQTRIFGEILDRLFIG